MKGSPRSSPPDRAEVAAAALATCLFCAAFSTLEGLATAVPGTPAFGLPLYWLGSALSWGTLSLIAWRLCRHGGHADPGVEPLPSARREQRKVRWLIVSVAVLLRLWVINATTPQLSDDMHRYVLDGRMLATGVNPYLHAPSENPAQDPPVHRLVQHINHPDMVTLYLPTSQFFFGAIAAMTDPARDPFGYIGFRLAFVVVEMCALLLVMRVLAAERRSVWWAVTYAWHPLAISEVAGSGHQDVLGMFLLVASLTLLTNARRSVSQRWQGAAGGALFALCAGVKPVALPLLVPIAWGMRQDVRMLVGFLVAALMATAAIMVPFLMMHGGLSGLWESGRTFLDHWSHNGSIHAVLAPWMGHAAASCGCFILLLGAVLVVARRGADLWLAALVCLFAEVLLSSTVHPWYLLWAMVLLPIRFNAALWVLTLTVTWSYAAWWGTSSWHLPSWVVIATYTPVYAVLALQASRTVKSKPPFASRHGD